MDSDHCGRQEMEKKLSEQLVEFIDLADEDLEEVDVVELGHVQGGQCGCSCSCSCSGCGCGCSCSCGGGGTTIITIPSSSGCSCGGGCGCGGGCAPVGCGCAPVGCGCGCGPACARPHNPSLHQPDHKEVS